MALAARSSVCTTLDTARSKLCVAASTNCRRCSSVPRLLDLFLTGGSRVRRRLAEKLQRSRHIGDLVAAVVLDMNIQIAIGDAAHGVAEQPEAAGNIAADIKPGDEGRPDDGREREHDQKNLARANLVRGLQGVFLRILALLVHQGIHRLLKVDGFGLCRCKCDLGIVLSIKLVRHAA